METKENIEPRCPKCGGLINAETIQISEEPLIVAGKPGVLYCLVCVGCGVALTIRLILLPQKELIEKPNIVVTH